MVAPIVAGEGISAKVASAAISFSASYILGQAAKARQEAAQQAAADSFYVNVTLNNKTSRQPCRVVYGRRKVGGNDVYRKVVGGKLWIIQTLSEGPIEGIDTDEDGNPLITIDDYTITELNKLSTDNGVGTIVQWALYKGTEDQDITVAQDPSKQTLVDEFVADCPEHTDNYRWMACLLFKLNSNRELLPTVPTRQAVIKGRVVYDFRDGTEKYSNNPMLAIYDYFSAPDYGLNQDATSIIDITVATETANYCLAKEFKINMVCNASENTAAWSYIESMMQLFRGGVSFYDSKYAFKYADLYDPDWVETPVLTITDDMIVQDDEGVSSVKMFQPDPYDRPTGIRVTFIDEDKEFLEDSFVIGDEDGVVEDYAIEGCTNRSMAYKLGVSKLERMILDRTLSMTLRDTAIIADPYDIVTPSFSLFNLSSGTKFRVNNFTYSDSGLINLSVSYDHIDVYNDNFDVKTSKTYRINKVPRTIIPQLLGYEVEEETYEESGRTFSRLNVSYDFDDYESFIKEIRVYTSETNEESAYKMQFSTTTNGFTIDKVKKGAPFYIKLRVLNVFNYLQPYNTGPVLFINTVGANGPPESLSGLAAIPQNDGLLLMASRLSDPDIEAYEFRYGPQWVGGIFIGAFRAPNHPLKGIKPGYFQFSANSLGTNGLYGTTPVYASARIASPTGYTLYDKHEDIYDSGSATFVNCEQIYYAGEYWLKCSHTNSILIGTYTGPTIDIGEDNANFYYTYLDLGETNGIDGILTTGKGTTFDEVFPAGYTFDELGIVSGVRFADLFELDGSPIVNIYIDWKRYETDAWNTIDRAEFSSAVVRARYYRIRIKITDPFSTMNALVRTSNLTLLKPT